MYENVRQSLEQCDVDADIQLFVTTKSTGTDRPGMEFNMTIFSYLKSDVHDTSDV